MNNINTKQRALLVITAIIVVAMLIFPPFIQELGSGVKTNLGYSFFLNPPSFPKTNTIKFVAYVNTSLLITQFIGAVLISISLFIALSKYNKE